MKITLKHIYLTIFFILIITPPLIAESLLDNGKEAFEQQKYDEALNAYNNAFLKYPDSKDIVFNQAAVLYKQEKYDEALSLYQNTLFSNDKTLKSKSLYNIGNIYFKKRDLIKSLENYKKSLELMPDFKNCKYNYEFVRNLIKEEKEKKDKQKKEDQQQGDKGQKDKKKNNQGQEGKKQETEKTNPNNQDKKDNPNTKKPDNSSPDKKEESKKEKASQEEEKERKEKEKSIQNHDKEKKEEKPQTKESIDKQGEKEYLSKEEAERILEALDKDIDKKKRQYLFMEKDNRSYNDPDYKDW